MEKTFVVITAQAIIPTNGRSPLDGAPIEYGDFCGLITGVVANICLQMSVAILKSECFEAEGRMAMIIRADATLLNDGLDHFRSLLELAGEKIGANIRVQKEDLFRYMHRI